VKLEEEEEEELRIWSVLRTVSRKCISYLLEVIAATYHIGEYVDEGTICFRTISPV
jgi:hypothetical protein